MWGGGADPDGDGRPNDVEYVFGGDPNVVDPVGLLSIVRDAVGNWVIDYARRSNDPDLDFMLEASADLVHWFDCSGFILSETPIAIDADREQVTLVLPGDLSAGALFFKVHVVW